MSTFNEHDHPRAKTGEFTTKTNSAPTATLMPADDITEPTSKELWQVNFQVSSRREISEVSDEAASIIARDLLSAAEQPEDYPLLNRIARGDATFSGDYDEIRATHDEIHELSSRDELFHNRPGSRYDREQRVDALYTWALNGGNNA